MRRSVQNNQIKTALKKFIKKLEQTNDISGLKKFMRPVPAAKTDDKLKNLLKGNKQTK